MSKKFKPIKSANRLKGWQKKRARQSAKQRAKKPQGDQAIIKAIEKAALEGVEIVTGRSKTIQDTSIGIVERSILDDIAQHALNIGGAGWPGVMANCRLSVMAAWQLGYTGSKPDFLPGEAVPVLVRSIQNLPDEDQERSVKIAASLAATAVSKTLAAVAKQSSARVHIWVAFLYGKDRRMMEAGAS